jgi:uncharacterized protein (TIGR03437 family)
LHRTILVAGSLLLAHVLQAQTPTITAVYGEAGTTSGLCPGGIAFVQGTNLGNNPNSITVTVGTKTASVINASNTSLQIELPFEAPLGATTIKVGASAPFNITLVQYSPGLPVNPQAGSIVNAFHNSPFAPVTTSYPATPNEQITVIATGLGPTKPAAATGFVPNDTSYAVVTLPTINVAGKAATVQSAFLAPNGTPGFYAVVFTMRSDVTSGNLSMTISIGGLTSNSGTIPVSTGPVVAAVSNAASYISSNLPNGAIAQGGIFVVQGINLGPANISIASAAFQSTTLSGTSISVTVGGTTVAPLMYYTSAGQVAALMPSNTPTGTGTITVTYNGQAGPASPIRVGLSAPGIFTVSSDGQGVGIVTYADYSLVSTVKAANCGGVNTTCGAANPGDALIIWATGLGAVSGGTDQSGAGLGVNLSSLPLTIWIGGVQATAVYQGRSGCCIGEDQIVFTVPANAPTGCNVPLTLQVNNFVSNSVAVPIAPAGSHTCASTNPVFNADLVTSLATTAGPITFGQVELKRSDNLGSFVDKGDAEFLRFSVPAALQPFIMSIIDVPPPGSCQIYNNPNGSPDPPLNILAALDAGPQVTVQGPNGSKNLPAGNGGYGATLSNTGTFFAPGTVTVSAPGGADVKAFSVPVTVPTLPIQTSPPPDAPNPFTVTRSNGLTVTWSGGAANGYIKLNGFNQTDSTGIVGASFTCIVPASQGTFTIPPYVLLALPTSGQFSFGGLDFHPATLPIPIPGSNLNISQVTLQYDYFTTMAFR